MVFTVRLLKRTNYGFLQLVSPKRSKLRFFYPYKLLALLCRFYHARRRRAAFQKRQKRREEEREEDRKRSLKVKTAGDICELKRNKKVSAINFTTISLSFLRFLRFSALFAEPPDRLAEALIIICEF